MEQFDSSEEASSRVLEFQSLGVPESYPLYISYICNCLIVFGQLLYFVSDCVCAICSWCDAIEICIRLLLHYMFSIIALFHNVSSFLVAHLKMFILFSVDFCLTGVCVLCRVSYCDRYESSGLP